MARTHEEIERTTDIDQVENPVGLTADDCHRSRLLLLLATGRRAAAKALPLGAAAARSRGGLLALGLAGLRGGRRRLLPQHLGRQLELAKLACAGSDRVLCQPAQLGQQPGRTHNVR